MQRLVVHIGAPKTGSTSLQRWFDRNREAALEHSIVYPAAGRHPVAGAHAHHNAVYGLHPGWHDEWFRPEQGDLAAVLAEARGSRARFGVISSEAFYDLPEPGIAAVREATLDLDVRVVAFVRRQDQYLESAYVQLARFGLVEGDVEAFFEQEPGRLDHLVHVERWSAAFGQEAMVVIPFEPDRVQAGVGATLLTSAGIPTEGLPQGERRVNVRMPPEVLDAVRHVRDRLREQLGPDFRLPLPIVSEIVRSSRGDPSVRSTGSLLSFEIAARVYASYAESNARLAERFGEPGRPDFFAAPPQPEEYAERAVARRRTPEEQVRLDDCVQRVLQESAR